jgi:hypothetical protein
VTRDRIDFSFGFPVGWFKLVVNSEPSGRVSELKRMPLILRPRLSRLRAEESREQFVSCLFVSATVYLVWLTYTVWLTYLVWMTASDQVIFRLNRTAVV